MSLKHGRLHTEGCASYKGFEGGVLEEGVMSVDWSDEGAFSCGGVMTSSKKLKKGDVSLEKLEDAHLTPNLPKSLLFIPPSRRPKKTQKLRLEKWKEAFDFEGKPVGFHKLLKIIRKGGVDHSIRAEVWEFLLGCYELGTTHAYRELVRQARRERYNELLEQCRTMHSSIGTGSLAYSVGSKVMDVRVTANVNGRKEDARVVEKIGDIEDQSKCQSTVEARGHTLDENSSPGKSVSSETREGPAPGAGSAAVKNINPQKTRADFNPSDSCPSFENEMEHERVLNSDDLRLHEPLPGEVDSSEQRPGTAPVKMKTSVEVNQDLIKDVVIRKDNRTMEECVLEKAQSSISSQSVGSMACTSVANGVEEPICRNMDVEEFKEEERNSSLIKSVDLDSLPGPGFSGEAEKVTDWLWTLHRIFVDVVRTDRHLEFYKKGKNSARMSDILAVYAWVDPATGYCQGMSDLLSPFIVLFDIDADAFWCFESLFKRVRDNFQMEGPVRVTKQLEAMFKILEVTDADMLQHLVLTGADNFLFAFRMLLVLFRREVSFAESLYMWEMMWAADFHQVTAWSFEHHSLEALRLPKFDSPARIYSLQEGEACEASSPKPSTPPRSPEKLRTSSSGSLGLDPLKWRTLAKTGSFCGLRPGRLWQMNRSRLNSSNICLSSPDGDQDISLFCVVAIMEQNRGMLMENLLCMDDAIKIFNSTELEFKVHSCVNSAVKLRKRYRNQSSKRITSRGDPFPDSYGRCGLTLDLFSSLAHDC